MNEPLSFERCRSFIDCQLQGAPTRSGDRTRMLLAPAITISRETGAGGVPVAERLAEYLQTRVPGSDCAWTVFDKNLVQQVLEDHHLPARLASYMPEDDVSEISDAMEEILGLHPPSWTLFHQTTETILRLAQLGHVILVGRGANVITAKLENAFHVRLIGSLEPRIRLVQEFYDLSRKAAAEFVRRHDRGRKRYLRKYFHQDIDNPRLYHLILNTDRFSCEEAARLLGEAVVRKFYPDRLACAA